MDQHALNPPDSRSCCRWTVCLGLLLLALLMAALILILRSKTPQGFQHAAVAADATLCSQIGRDILQKDKGSAVDAAIASLLCVSLMNPQSMGLGGGVIFTIFNASTGVGEVIMARETAPRQVSKDLCMRRNITDPAMIAVPGEIRGYALAHQRHGRLPWARLFEPAIDLAERGVPVSRALRERLEYVNNLFRAVQRNKHLCEIYCGEDGNILKENDIVKYPSLARTYRAIAERGPQEFYTGSVAQKLVRDVKAAGYLKKLRTDPDEILWTGSVCEKDELIRFW